MCGSFASTGRKPRRADHLPIYSPTSLAAEKGSAETLELLLGSGADPNWTGSPPPGKWTPIHRASKMGHAACVRVLLDFGADANAADEDGDSPLHVAAFNARPGVVAELLRRGARPSARNADGDTPLDDAKSDECRQLLAAACSH